MSALTAEATRAPGRIGVSFARVLHSEWTKLHSLRSSRVSLLVAVGLVVGLGLLVPWITVHDWTSADEARRSGFDPIQRSLAGMLLAQLAFGVLGVLLISGEYATGMIRATLAAVPRRLPVLGAKLLVFGTTTLVLGVLSSLIAVLAGQSIFAAKGVGMGLDDPGVLRAVVGAGLYLAAIGLLGVGLGALTRNTAAGIATLVALLFVLPPIVDALPGTWPTKIAPYLPGNAGHALFSLHRDAGQLAPWVGFGVLCAYAAVAAALAAVTLARRDV